VLGLGVVAALVVVAAVTAVLVTRLDSVGRGQVGHLLGRIPWLLTGLAALVAVAVALPSSALVLRALDPVPELRPDPLFAVPWGDLGIVLAGVVLVTVGGAALVGRTARRDSGGQVLRDAA
jgi:hypothetical protein